MVIDMFEVGQTVWDVRKGRGVVDGINLRIGNRPVRVRFNGSGFSFYTACGKASESDLYRSLYFSEPSVSGATTPPFTRKTKDFETVVLRSKLPAVPPVLITVGTEDENYIWDTHGVRWTKSVYTIHRIGEEIY